MDPVVLALIAVASLATTWFVCLRPMRRGWWAMGESAGDRDGDLKRQIAELTEEVRVLRAQDALAEDRPVQRRRDG